MIQLKIIKMLIIAFLCMIALSSVANAVTVKAVYAGGTTSYAIADDGSVWAWGDYGGVNNLHPVKVSFVDNVTMLSANSNGAAALKEDGTVWRWEQKQGYTNVGTGVPNIDDYDITKIDITGVKYIASSSNTLFMVKADGTLWVCGYNDDGVFGNPDFTKNYSAEPVKASIDHIRRVVVAFNSVFAQKDDGSWWDWGNNDFYVLDDGTTEIRYAPVRLNIDNVKDISPSGDSNILMLTTDGTVFTWGLIAGGQAGDPSVARLGVSADNKAIYYNFSSPREIPGMIDVRAIGSGTGYCVALNENGTVLVWGDFQQSYSHALGSLESYSPITVPGLQPTVMAISVGQGHSFAVESDGSIWAWGQNTNGQLGDGTVPDNPLVDPGKAKAVRVQDVTFDLNSEATIKPTPIPSPEKTSTPTTTLIADSSLSEAPDSTSLPSSTIIATHLVSPTAPVTDENVLSISGNGLLAIVVIVLGVIVVAGGAVYLFLRKRE